MIWSLPCLQLYIYPCSPNHFNSTILNYFSSLHILCFFLWYHLFSFTNPPYLNFFLLPCWSSCTYISGLSCFSASWKLFWKYIYHSPKSTIPSFKAIRKAKIVHVSIMLITLYCHFWLSCWPLCTRLRSSECKNTPC